MCGFTLTSFYMYNKEIKSTILFFFVQEKDEKPAIFKNTASSYGNIMLIHNCNFSKMHVLKS